MPHPESITAGLDAPPTVILSILTPIAAVGESLPPHGLPKSPWAKLAFAVEAPDTFPPHIKYPYLVEAFLQAVTCPPAVSPLFEYPAQLKLQLSNTSVFPPNI